MAYNSLFGLADEGENVFNLCAHGNLFGYLDDGIFEAEVAGVDDAEGVGNVAQDAVCGMEVAQHYAVDTVVSGGVASENNVGGHVFGDTASALYQGEQTYAHMGLDDYAVAEDGAVVYLALTCDAAANADDTLVVDGDVVADVYAVHDEVAIADDGGCLGLCAACNDHILTYLVVVAYHYVGGFAFHVMEVLWLGADDGIVVDMVAGTDGGAVEDGGVRFDDAVVADDHVLLYVGEGSYLNVGS